MSRFDHPVRIALVVAIVAALLPSCRTNRRLTRTAVVTAKGPHDFGWGSKPLPRGLAFEYEECPGHGEAYRLDQSSPDNAAVVACLEAVDGHAAPTKSDTRRGSVGRRGSAALAAG